MTPQKPARRRRDARGGLDLRSAPRARPPPPYGRALGAAPPAGPGPREPAAVSPSRLGAAPEIRPRRCPARGAAASLRGTARAKRGRRRGRGNGARCRAAGHVTPPRAGPGPAEAASSPQLAAARALASSRPAGPRRRPPLPRLPAGPGRAGPPTPPHPSPALPVWPRVAARAARGSSVRPLGL